MTSPFADFRLFTLVFNVGSGTTGEDERGNPVAVAGEEVAVSCYLKSTTDPRVLRLAGADTTITALKGRLVDPMSFPEGIHAGMTCPLELDGNMGVFTLGTAWPSIVPQVEEALGQPIIGTWRAD